MKGIVCQIDKNKDPVSVLGPVESAEDANLRAFFERNSTPTPLPRGAFVLISAEAYRKMESDLRQIREMLVEIKQRLGIK